MKLILAILILIYFGLGMVFFPVVFAADNDEKASVFYYLGDTKTKTINGTAATKTKQIQVIEGGASEVVDGKKMDKISPNGKFDSVDDIGEEQADNSGKFYERAKILALDIYNGKTSKIAISKHQAASFAGLQLILHTCWQEHSVVYQPEAKALVEINDEYSNKQIFTGWMLARHRALSQSKYKHYMFFLQGCVE